jgi:hypothetical protein
MNKIYTVVAGDKNFEKYVSKCVEYSMRVGYDTKIYDLGNLGMGKPYQGRVSPQIGAKIPSKPGIILDAINEIDEYDYVAWIDADALIQTRFDEVMEDYDIGVTVRQPKQKENSMPINAGIVFVRKTSQAIKFLNDWILLCESGVSDQQELNKLCQVTTKDLNTLVIRNDTKIRVFPCAIYNNVYFAKKKTPNAKIKHYKSKLRSLWPED